MVTISYCGKHVILARVVKLEIFTLSAHEVLRAGLWVVVFLWAKVATWLGVVLRVVVVVFDVLRVVLEGFFDCFLSLLNRSTGF